jgi:hypothetical protein
VSGKKAKRFLGYALHRGTQKSVVSLIEMTTGRFGVHKSYFKTEDTFWTAIEFVTGMCRQSNEGFIDAVHRIQGTIGAHTVGWRVRMIEAVNRRGFYEAIGMKLHEVVSFDQIQANAKAKGQNLADPSKPAIRKPKLKKSIRPSVAAKDEFYQSWEWRTLRMEAIKEHGRSCQCCGATPGMKDASGNPVRICVDHIKPISKYWHLRLDRSNLQILCDECNMGKGNWDETDFRPVEGPDEWIIDDVGVSDAIQPSVLRAAGRPAGRAAS